MTTTAKTFHAERASAIPGDHSLKLLREWQGLPAGTVVQPAGHGHNNATGRDERTVNVISGPRAGERVNGPL